ncbi:hypothetical protein C8R45DRAFT_1084352 [Mycena sanguinolenta]|nr:hypothetical protein C8R45DRAFT_1084352 [Mycena sanguinolenta]
MVLRGSRVMAWSEEGGWLDRGGDPRWNKTPRDDDGVGGVRSCVSEGDEDEDAVTMALEATVRKGTGRGWDGMWVVWVPSAHLHYGSRAGVLVSSADPSLQMNGKSFGVYPRLRATSSATATATSPSGCYTPLDPTPPSPPTLTPALHITDAALRTETTHLRSLRTTTATATTHGCMAESEAKQGVVVVQLREEEHEKSLREARILRRGGGARTVRDSMAATTTDLSLSISLYFGRAHVFDPPTTYACTRSSIGTPLPFHRPRPRVRPRQGSARCFDKARVPDARTMLLSAFQGILYPTSKSSEMALAVAGIQLREEEGVVRQDRGQRARPSEYSCYR